MSYDRSAPALPAALEDLFLACLCREPEFWLVVDITPTDLHPDNQAGRSILESGLDLLKNGHQPTLVNLARHGAKFGIESYDNLRVRAELADEGVRADFLDIMSQVKGETIRRSLKAALKSGHDEATTCSVFDLPALLSKVQVNLARLDSWGDKDEDHDLGSIIDRLIKGDAAVGKPMPTRWRWWNEMSGGGLHAKHLWSIGGAPGKRKTTFLYNLGVDWSEAGYRIMHVAVDGGDKFQQGIRYVTLLWEKVCMEAGVERDERGNVVHKYHDNERWLSYSYIRPKTVRQLIDPKTYGNIVIPIPDPVMECYQEALRRMRHMKTANDNTGWVRMFDAGDIHDSAVLERRLHVEQQILGIDAFFIDHMGEIEASEGKTENDQRNHVTRAVVRFKNRYNSRAVVLAQRTDAANWGEEKDKERPGLLNLKKLEQASDLIGITEYDPATPYHFAISLYKNREDEHGTGIKAKFKILPASGLITERVR